MKPNKIGFRKLERDCRDLADKILPYEYHFVFGIPHGGILPAFIIAKRINAMLIASDQMKQIQEAKKLANCFCNVLVVDDIVDSGKTLEKYKEFDTAVIYRKKGSPFYPSYYLEEVSNDWISLPHEKEQVEIETNIQRILQYTESDLSKNLLRKELMQFLQEIQNTP